MIVAGVTAATASIYLSLALLAVTALMIVWYVIQQRKNDKDETSDDARTEALALAETRGKRIDDLEADIERLRKARDEDRSNHAKDIRSLRDQIAALEERLAATTSNFAAAQSLTAQAAYDLAASVVDRLEQKPAKTGEALALLHSYMAGFTATPGKPSR